MLDETIIEGIVSHYSHASAFQKWHMRGRLKLCPYDALLKHLEGWKKDQSSNPADEVEKPISILDIGCGFGHFGWYLKNMHLPLKYLGVDIDSRKIALAKGSLTEQEKIPKENSVHKPLEFIFGNCSEIISNDTRFQNIVILDVIYLLPWDLQVQLIEWCLLHLDPNCKSALVIKTMDVAEGWVGWRTVAEEWIMVHLLRRTQSSGTINGIKPFQNYVDVFNRLGFNCEIENLPTWNPSSIFKATRK